MTTVLKENWFERAWKWIEGETEKVPEIENTIATFADKVTNVLKTNPTAIFAENALVSIAETVDPALTPMIQGLELEIPKLLKLLSNGKLEFAKPIVQQGEDVFAWLGGLAGSKSAFAGVLATINSGIQYYVTSNNGITASPAQLLAAGQVNHANNG